MRARIEHEKRGQSMMCKSRVHSAIQAIVALRSKKKKRAKGGKFHKLSMLFINIPRIERHMCSHFLPLTAQLLDFIEKSAQQCDVAAIGSM
jgi:hypothetical protein